MPEDRVWARPTADDAAGNDEGRRCGDVRRGHGRPIPPAGITEPPRVRPVEEGELRDIGQVPGRAAARIADERRVVSAARGDQIKPAPVVGVVGEAAIPGCGTDRY